MPAHRRKPVPLGVNPFEDDAKTKRDPTTNPRRSVFAGRFA